MSYSYNKFLRPITSSDKNIKILDDSNDIKYTIDPFVILNVSVSNNILKINLKSQRIISLHFSTINEAKLALTRIRIQIDTLIKNVPHLIDRDVQNYVDSIFSKVSIIVGPTGATGAADRYSATSSTSFQFPVVGEVIDLVTQSNLAYTSAQSVIVYNDIPNLYNNNYEEGGDYFVSRIDTYDKITGEMTLVVDFSTIITPGGTFSFWYMNLTGEKGQADKYYTTSSTTLSVPEIGQVIDLEVETYLAYSSSQNVVVYSDLPNLYDFDYETEGGYFTGQVDYYDFSTGLISIVVENSIGSGTYSTWYMNLSGTPGIDGTTASNIDLTGLTTDIIPAVDSLYSLGTSASQWKSLHVSGQTIYIGGVPLSTDGDSLVVSSINLGTTASPLILSANNDVLLLNGTGSVGATGATGADGLQGIQGPTGTDGHYSEFIGTFQSENDLINTYPTPPQPYYWAFAIGSNPEDLWVYRADPSGTWASEKITLPIGVTGSDGLQGATGVTGPQGIQGATGPADNSIKRYAHWAPYISTDPSGMGATYIAPNATNNGENGIELTNINSGGQNGLINWSSSNIDWTKDFRMSVVVYLSTYPAGSVGDGFVLYAGATAAVNTVYADSADNGLKFRLFTYDGVGAPHQSGASFWLNTTKSTQGKTGNSAFLGIWARYTVEVCNDRVSNKRMAYAYFQNDVNYGGKWPLAAMDVTSWVPTGNNFGFYCSTGAARSSQYISTILFEAL